MIFAHPDIVCATSRRPRNMSLSYGDTSGSLENRRVFLSGLGIDYRELVCAQQVHEDVVACVDESYKGRGALSYTDAIAGTDALITSRAEVPLAVFTADCLCVFLYDPSHKVAGLVHAGWRGSLKGIAVKALKVMAERFSTRPQDILVGFGPAIKSCCYEVGAEFKQLFPAETVERGGHFFLDVTAVNKRQLADAGVPAGHMSDQGLCTSCNSADFFSFRKEGNLAGRMISVIMRKAANA